MKNEMMYAERVLKLYKKCNDGNQPKDIRDATLAVREYNSNIRKYKSLFGESIRGKVERIAEFVLEGDAPMTVARLRKIYPRREFYFFKDGYEMQKAPFYHAEAKDFREVGSDVLFIMM